MIFAEWQKNKIWYYRSEDLWGEIEFWSEKRWDKDDLDWMMLFITKQPAGKGKLNYKGVEVEYEFDKKPLWEKDEKKQ